MIITTLSQHYKQMLGLDETWDISEVDLNIEETRLIIKIFSCRGAKLTCPTCSKLCPKEDSREERSWRHLDTMQFETLIKCRIPRVRCSEHGVKTAMAPWANNHSRFTLLFERFAIDVLKSAQTITGAQRLLRLSWKQIHRIQRMAVTRGLKRRSEIEVKRVGIDEKSFLKGHSYVSILNDIDKKRVLEVEEGRTQEAATKLLETISKAQRDGVEAIAMDMWKAFMNAAGQVIPRADIVHDKYHVVGYLGKAVDSVRKMENKFLTKRGDNLLVGSKYVWLTNPDNFTHDAKRSFKKLMKNKLKVGRAWSIKETFSRFWTYSYKGVAIKFFKKWYFWATHSRLKPIIKAAKTIKRHFDGILAYLDHYITNAVSEGINSKIQSIKASARGFRNFQNYRISILFHCGKLNLYP